MDQYFPSDRGACIGRKFLEHMRDMQAELIQHKLGAGLVPEERRESAINTVVRLTMNRSEALV